MLLHGPHVKPKGGFLVNRGLLVFFFSFNILTLKLYEYVHPFLLFKKSFLSFVVPWHHFWPLWSLPSGWAEGMGGPLCQMDR